jgi:hypothetical protein
MSGPGRRPAAIRQSSAPVGSKRPDNDRRVGICPIRADHVASGFGRRGMVDRPITGADIRLPPVCSASYFRRKCSLIKISWSWFPKPLPKMLHPPGCSATSSMPILRRIE